MGKWLAPLGNCDNCGAVLENTKTFYDACIGRRWGLFCPDCFRYYNGKLGTGLGQEYNTKTREKLRG